MKTYTVKVDTAAERKLVVDDMILTKDIPTTAGSKMLDGYVSLFESEALSRLLEAGYGLTGKADVGEFAIDLLGETSYNGAIYKDGKAVSASAEIISGNEADVALCLDVNGSVRRAAAQSKLVSVKPTYGMVSRYGVVPVACSGESLSLMARDADACRAALDIVSAYDAKDGTSLPEGMRCYKTSPVSRVAVLSSMLLGVDDDVKSAVGAVADQLKAKGVEVVTLDDSVVAASRAAWNILMCAELCNNVSRYDGVKYGYRAESFSGIDELYTNSRTEAFGELLKTAILFGSETLSTDNYMKVYDKALRTRRVIVEAFAKIFESFDAVLMPACSKMAYTEESIEKNKHFAFEENYYTAPASVTGLPAVVFGGVQLVGPAFSEKSLLDAAEMIEKEVC